MSANIRQAGVQAGVYALGASASTLLFWPLLSPVIALYRHMVPDLDWEIPFMVMPWALVGAVGFFVGEWAARRYKTTVWYNRLRLGWMIIAGAITGQICGQFMAVGPAHSPQLLTFISQSPETVNSVLPACTCALAAFGCWIYELYPKHSKAFFRWWRGTYSGAMTVNAVAAIIVFGPLFLVVWHYNILDVHQLPASVWFMGVGLAALLNATQGFVRIADRRGEFWPLIVLKYAGIGVAVVVLGVSMYFDVDRHGGLKRVPYLPAFLVFGALAVVTLRYRWTAFHLLRLSFTHGPAVTDLFSKLSGHGISAVTQLGVLGIVGLGAYELLPNLPADMSGLLVGGLYVAFGGVAIGIIVYIAISLNEIAKLLAPFRLAIPADRIAPGGRRTATLAEALRAGRDRDPEEDDEQF